MNHSMHSWRTSADKRKVTAIEKPCLRTIAAASLIALSVASQRPAFADNWTMTMTVDNQYTVYFGDQYLTTPTIVGSDAAWATTETWNINNVNPADFLYVATASDHSGAQGFLGTFTNTTTSASFDTNDNVGTPWQVFPAGQYLTQLNAIDSSFPTTTWPSLTQPTTSQVQTAVTFATQNSLWVPVSSRPGWTNGVGPWNVRPGIPTSTEWIWHNTGRDSSSAAPFSGFNHDEFLVFRVPGRPVPEPSSLMLLCGSALALWAVRRSRRRPASVAIMLVTMACVSSDAIGEDTVAVREDGSALYTWDPDIVRPGESFLTTSIPPALPGGSNVGTLIGADRWYNAGYKGAGTISLNSEAGHIWGTAAGHETLTHVTNFSNHPSAPALPFARAAYDRHATWVGMMIGGRKGGPPQFQGDFQTGIAPDTDLRSGAIAMAWFGGAFSGQFGITAASADFPYAAGFGTANVINSSWGATGGPGSPQASGTDFNAMLIDSLANRNPLTTSVVAAGNSGPGANTVGSPGSGYNSITVGALANNGADVYNAVANFSSRGPQDYDDPLPPTLPPLSRASVDIVAPGTHLFGAYYGGQSGGNDASLPGSPGGPLGGPNFYSGGLQGTSFAAPIVAGSVALMNNAAISRALPTQARDSRVIKANLLNAATKTPGWNNGQVPHSNGGVFTFQSLDYVSGAGALNLDRTFDQYLSGQTDIVGTTGGSTSKTTGWDYGVMNGVGTSNDIVITTPMSAGTEFRVTLDWFRDRTYLSATSQIDAAYSDLALQVWDSTFTTQYSSSNSPATNVEHLTFNLPVTGMYGIRVHYFGNLFGNDSSEAYGLAWSGVGVPEPSSALLTMIGLVAFVAHRQSRSMC